MPKDQGAEQGLVDGPLQCSLAPGMVAAETRGSIDARQAAGTLPWIGVNDPAEEQRFQADHAVRLPRTLTSPTPESELSGNTTWAQHRLSGKSSTSGA